MDEATDPADKGCWETGAAGGSGKICSTNDGTANFVSKTDCELENKAG